MGPLFRKGSAGGGKKMAAFNAAISIVVLPLFTARMQMLVKIRCDQPIHMALARA
jgi:citrate lyase alpha subunit